MCAMSRRRMMKGVMAGAVLAATPEVGSPLTREAQQEKPPAYPLSAAADMPAKAILRKDRIKQSACRWCYPKYSVDDLCAYGAKIGLKGIDLLQPADFAVPPRYGIVCSMGYADAGTIKDGLNRLANHDAIETGMLKNIPLAAKAGVPNVITFSGLRAGMPDEEGLKNSITGLNRVKKIAEDHGVVVCVELLNSKVNHHDYMADNSAWGVKLMEAVNSPNVKLLFDIYHMQIQEGDLITTIRANIQWMGIFIPAASPAGMS
jgi:hydroxypyruvate isomerase